MIWFVFKDMWNVKNRGTYSKYNLLRLNTVITASILLSSPRSSSSSPSLYLSPSSLSSLPQPQSSSPSPSPPLSFYHLPTAPHHHHTWFLLPSPSPLSFHHWPPSHHHQHRHRHHHNQLTIFTIVTGGILLKNYIHTKLISERAYRQNNFAQITSATTIYSLNLTSQTCYKFNELGVPCNC